MNAPMRGVNLVWSFNAALKALLHPRSGAKV
jgi:hypothetical protein